MSRAAWLLEADVLELNSVKAETGLQLTGSNAWFLSGSTVEPVAGIHGFDHGGASTLTLLSIPSSYGYDFFTCMVTEFKRAGWGACGAEM